MIIGTAGHIDHGKTSLVKALTGVDTDRLPEEQRRGITIELGFAPLQLPGIGTVGVVDVPGHEAFVRTMVAGATGIDLGLLVIAADEGVMPQTREHLAILRLLGVTSAVVAITKADLADPEWLSLVQEEARELVQDTPLADAPVLPVSVRTGAGLVALTEALVEGLRAARPRERNDVARLPIDRAFTVKGTGTVVTGTLWSGELTVDTPVVLFPGMREVRIRGLQQHGSAVRQAVPGSRVAVAISGVDVADVPRGSVLLDRAPWIPSDVLHAEVWLEPGAASFRPREWLRLHLGTAEVGARVVGRGDASGAVRLVCESSVVARAGDRFVLRRSQPLTTVGGGVVLDPSPARRRSRPEGLAGHTAVQRLESIVRASGGSGLATAAIPIRVGVDLPTAGRILGEARTVRRIGDRVYLEDAIDRVAQVIAEHVVVHHRRSPVEEGLPLSVARALFPDQAQVLDEALRRLQADGLVEVESGLLRQPGWAPRLTDEMGAQLEQALGLIRGAGREPPSAEELAAALSAPVAAVVALLRFAERRGEVVGVEGDRWYASAVVEGMIGDVRATLAGADSVVSPAQFRERLGVSRKFLMPFLEYCDRQRITERRGEGRVEFGSRV